MAIRRSGVAGGHGSVHPLGGVGRSRGSRRRSDDRAGANPRFVQHDLPIPSEPEPLPPDAIRPPDIAGHDNNNAFLGYRDTGARPPEHRAAVAPSNDDDARQQRDAETGCNGVADAPQQQSDDIAAKHRRRRRENLQRLHGVLGTCDAHEQAGVGGGVQAHADAFLATGQLGLFMDQHPAIDAPAALSICSGQDQEKMSVWPAPRSSGRLW
jgi:hypothetical protein